MSGEQVPNDDLQLLMAPTQVFLNFCGWCDYNACRAGRHDGADDYTVTAVLNAYLCQLRPVDLPEWSEGWYAVYQLPKEPGVVSRLMQGVVTICSWVRRALISGWRRQAGGDKGKDAINEESINEW